MPREAANHRALTSEDEIVKARPYIIPRTKPTPIPTPSIFDEPSYCLKVNKAWAAHFLGVILVLNNPDTWKPDETHDVEWARNQVVEWVAKFLTEDMCMPCCDDLIEQITNLVTINTNMLTQITTIVTNLTTIINNQTTVINQGDTIDTNNQYNQIINQYNTFITNNNDARTFNQMFYDGTPQSIAPSLGDNFSSGGSSEAALCVALKRFMQQQMYVAGYQGALTTGAEEALVGLATAVFSGFTGGLSVPIGIAVGVGVASSFAAYNTALNDPEAQRKVLCCLFDSLKDQAITEENFKNMGTSCDFETLSHEFIIWEQMTNAAFNYPENYTAFLSMLGQSQNQGNVEDCNCDCDDDIVLEDVGGTGTVITPMGNCLYKFVQPTLNTEFNVYYFAFRDIMGRCLHVENSPDPSKPTIGVGYYTTVVDCDDVESSFPGGFAPGDLHSAHWFQGAPNNVTYYKVTLAE